MFTVVASVLSDQEFVMWLPGPNLIFLCITPTDWTYLVTTVRRMSKKKLVVGTQPEVNQQRGTDHHDLPANCGGPWGSVPLTVEQHLRLEFEKGHFQYLNFLWISVLVGNINFGEQRKSVDAWLWINIVHLPMGLFLIYMMSFTLASQDWNVECITEFFTVLCQSYFAHT